MKTFKELESLAYMSNLPKIAALYAQLDDNEQAENEIERLNDKIHDLEMDCDYLSRNSEVLEKRVETLQGVLKKIEDIINE
jgi:chromosome segregation ATPase